MGKVWLKYVIVIGVPSFLGGAIVAVLLLALNGRLNRPAEERGEGAPPGKVAERGPNEAPRVLGIDLSFNPGERVFHIRTRFTHPMDRLFVPTEPPLRFDVPVEGTFRWEDEWTLLFVAESLPPRPRLIATVSSQLHDKLGRPLAGSLRFTVTGAALRVEEVRQDGVAEDGHAIILLKFNDEVQPESLRRFLQISAGDRELRVTPLGRSPRKSVRVVLRRPFTGPVNLLLEAGLPAQHLRYLPKSFARKLEIRSHLVVLRVKPEWEEGIARIRVRFNGSVPLKALQQYLEVSPPVGFALGRDSGDPVLGGNFKPGRAYMLTFRKGLRGGGLVLPENTTYRILFPDVSPSFRFVGEGFYLPRTARPVIKLSSVNVRKCKLTLERLYPQNVVEFARDGGLRYIPAFTAQEFPPKELHIRGEPNQWVTTEIDLEALLGKKPTGTFCVTARQPDDRWWRYTQVLLQITDLGITCKRSQRNLLVWVASLSTAEPVEGCEVRVLSRTNRVLAKGLTDPKGTVIFRGPFSVKKAEEPFVVAARKGDDEAFVVLSKMTSVRPELELGKRAYPAGPYEAFVWTERGVYRPGETINVYTVVRDRYMTAPEAFPLRFEVLRPDGKVWKVFTGEPTPESTCHLRFSLPRFAQTGAYTIRVLGGGEYVLGERKVLLEEVRPDRIRLRLSLKEKQLKGGQMAYLRVSAMHFFGKPAAGNTAQARLELVPVSFAAKGFEKYDFASSSSECNRNRLSFLLGSEKLDKNGEAVFEVELPRSPLPPERYMAVFTCSVTEQGGRAVTARLARPLDLYRAYLGVACETVKPSVGREARFSIVALKPDGSPAAISAVVARLVRLFYYTSYEQQGGKWRWLSRSEEHEVTCESIPLTDGRGTFSFVPREPGKYVLRIQAGGTRHRTSYRFRVDGPSWPLRSFADPAEVAVSVDKRSYAPGGEAAITIVSPFAGTMLLTVEGDAIHEAFTRRIKAGSNDIKIRVRDTYWPNVYVSCTVVRPYLSTEAGRADLGREVKGPAGDLPPGKARVMPAGIPLSESGSPVPAISKSAPPKVASKPAEVTQAEELLRFKPYVACGTALLRIDPASREVKVTLETPKEVKPGDTLTVAVKTQAPDGSPLQAEFVLAAVDEGLLSLTAERAPDPLGFFAAVRRPTCRTAEAYSFLIPPKWLVPGGGAGSLASALARRLNPVQYETPRPIAFFFPPARTGADGQATVELEVPDFAGSLRVVAIAVTRRMVGAARSDVTVKPAVTIRENFPRFLAPGDSAVTPLVFFNNEDKERELELTITCSGPLAVRCEGIISLEPNGSATTPVTLIAGKQPGLAKLEIAVSGSSFNWSRSFELPVRPAWGRTSISGSGVVKPGSKDEPILSDKASLPDFFEGTGEARLVLSPSVRAEFAPLAGYLIRYPYGCAEQTCSCLLASAVAAELGVEEEKTAASAIARAVERLASMQTPEGGFAMWPGGTRPVPWITAFAGHVLYTVREGNEVLIGELLKDVLGYLRGGLRKWESLDARAYAAFVCALAGEDIGPETLRLAQENLSRRGRYFVEAALKLLGRRKAAEELRRLPILGNKKSERDEIRYVSRIVDDAIGLLTASVSGEPELRKQLVGPLRKVAAEKGWWVSTHERAWALLALTSWAEAKGQSDVHTPKVELRLGDRVLFSGRLTKPRGFDVSPADLAALRCTVQDGNLYFSWIASGVTKSAPPVKHEGEKQEQEFAVSKRFFDFVGNPVTAQEFVLGTPYIVELSFSSRRHLSDVVVVDLLPACFEIENPHLASRLSWEKGSNPFMPVAHIDIRDDRLLLFTDIPETTKQGPARFRYVVRAIAEGVFCAPGTEASCMYEPEIEASTESSAVQVKKNL